MQCSREAVHDSIDVRLGALADRAAVARWATREEAIEAGALAATLEQVRAIYSVSDPRACARLLTGWLAGPVAGTVAALAVGDRIGIDLPASEGVELGLAAAGYVAGLRIRVPRVVALADHAWVAHGSGVEVAADGDALDERVVAGIVAWCAPVIAAIDVTGRGSAPLWGQVTDALGYVAPQLAGLAPETDPQLWIDRTRRLLAAPSLPSRTLPALWVAASDAGPVAVCHRSGCCMYYRSEESPDDDAGIDAGFLARFGNAPPRYCGTCRLRSAEDVEARVVYWAELEASGRG